MIGLLDKKWSENRSSVFAQLHSLLSQLTLDAGDENCVFLPERWNDCTTVIADNNVTALYHQLVNTKENSESLLVYQFHCHKPQYLFLPGTTIVRREPNGIVLFSSGISLNQNDYSFLFISDSTGDGNIITLNMPDIIYNCIVKSGFHSPYVNSIQLPTQSNLGFFSIIDSTNVNRTPYRNELLILTSLVKGQCVIVNDMMISCHALHDVPEYCVINDILISLPSIYSPHTGLQIHDVNDFFSNAMKVEYKNSDKPIRVLLDESRGEVVTSLSHNYVFITELTSGIIHRVRLD